MKPLFLLRYIWAFPNTALGLLLLPCSFVSKGRLKVVGGVLEISGNAVAWVLDRIPFAGPAAALTLGHVVLAADEEVHERWRDHERIHVRQYERWGPFFIPAYLASTVVARLRGDDGYFGNRFEAEAFARGRNIT